jgi:hypothetical protein
MALHVLLAVAAVLVGGPASIKVLAVLAIIGHAVVRRPPPSPHLIVVGEDGCCVVPEWHTGRRPFGPRTLMGPFWIRIDLGKGSWRRDILLVADQIPAADWRRLRALLARTCGD